MADTATFKHIGVSREGAITLVEIRRGPNNFVDTDMVAEIADVLEAWTARATAARSCCVPRASISAPGPISPIAGRMAWRAAARAGGISTRRRSGCGAPASRSLRRCRAPRWAPGVGLAVMADFRVTCPEARFSANFTRLGYHPGFGLTATLPRLVGMQAASMLMYTGRRVTGDEAVTIGLADYCVPLDQVRAKAIEVASEIAASGPLAIVSTRETLRRGLADAVARATEREYEEQDWLRKTDDFREGIKAMAERRPANFTAA